jgi:hexosaminidase
MADEGTDRIDLLPRPYALTLGDGRYRPPSDGVVAVRSEPPTQLFAARRLARALERATGGVWSLVGGREPAEVALDIDAGGAPAEGYRLEIDPHGVSLVAGDAAGLFYGVSTLCQLLAVRRSALPALRIDDRPGLRTRGVMLDISRDKVPTLATLKGLIDLLASWKVNHVQLYMEHTFAYRAHPEVWAAASPLTAEEILDLDAFCRERHVELVPNQNSFGHMERWFRHSRYRPMAETEHGLRLPWGEVTRWPITLSPAHPDALTFLDGLYAELLPNFSSRRFNVGCDETFGLGDGRSRELVAAKGGPRTWLDFVMEIRGLAARHGRSLQIWGDMVRRNPDLIADMPRDITILDWGYERERSLAASARPLAEAGQPFYLCPGTSSWSSIAGRTDNAVANIRDAVETAHQYGADGVLLTDWGDGGHWQHLPVSYLGYAWSAALSWSLAANRDLDLPRALDCFAFCDRAGVMGKLAWDLGNAYQQVGFRHGNTTPLHMLYTATIGQAREALPQPREGGEVLASDERVRQGLERAVDWVESAAADLARTDLLPNGEGHALHDPDLVRREFAHAAAMLRHGARRGLFELGATEPDAGRLRAELDAITAEFVALWTIRNRPGGLSDSLARLLSARALFEDD